MSARSAKCQAISNIVAEWLSLSRAAILSDSFSIGSTKEVAFSPTEERCDMVRERPADRQLENFIWRDEKRASAGQAEAVRSSSRFPPTLFESGPLAFNFCRRGCTLFVVSTREETTMRSAWVAVALLASLDEVVIGFVPMKVRLNSRPRGESRGFTKLSARGRFESYLDELQKAPSSADIRAVFTTMQRRGVPPEVFHFNAAITRLGRLPDPGRESKAMFTAMLKASISPDAYTFSSLISASDRDWKRAVTW